MNNKWILSAGLVIIGFVLFYLFQKYKVPPQIDFRKLDLVNMQGQKVSLAEFKGKKLVLCFGASWCGPCREEMEAINEMKSALPGDVEIVMISDEPVEKIKEFSSTMNYPFLFLKSDQPLTDLGINSIPTSYIVNSRMKVVQEKVGYIDWRDPSTFEHLMKLMEDSL
jgi:thiol-disulfide isomerase/thioredoxin